MKFIKYVFEKVCYFSIKFAETFYIYILKCVLGRVEEEIEKIKLFFLSMKAMLSLDKNILLSLHVNPM